jgi:hypothetical protein
MNLSSSTGVAICADCLGRSVTGAGLPRTMGLDATTVPPASRTWTTSSSSSATARVGGSRPASSCAATSAARARAAERT